MYIIDDINIVLRNHIAPPSSPPPENKMHFTKPINIDFKL